jgi:hypothetical protein
MLDELPFIQSGSFFFPPRVEFSWMSYACEAITVVLIFFRVVAVLTIYRVYVSLNAVITDVIIIKRRRARLVVVIIKLSVLGKVREEIIRVDH